MLAPDRWSRLRDLLERAIDLPVQQRRDYLARECPDDPDVRREAEAILEAHDAAGTYLDPPQSPWFDTPATESDAPLLTPGTLLGTFEIVSLLGAGGMGQVYKARDTRLDRSVAIKVVSGMTGRVGHGWRFEREARALSQLAHPHICVLHDICIARQDGTERPFLVMELLEGETLSARLARGPLPIDQAIAHAAEVADALSAAHAKGVVHGDLKPANIMLTKAGVKLLDFGLARLHGPAASPSPGHEAAGIVAGTFPYMAPEQLRGKEGDARSDLFAFGAVVYEMLTARRAFQGDSRAEVIEAILHRDPAPLTDVQPLVPSSLDRLVRTCLAKDPSERWQSAHDAALRLREVQEARHEPPARRPARPRPVALAGWLLAITLAVVVGFSDRTEDAKRAVPRRLMLDAAQVTAGEAWAPVISPDGSAVAIIAGREGGDRVVVTELGSGETRQLRLHGSACAWGAAWSHDGRTLIYGAADLLLAMDIRTGATTTVARSSDGRPAPLRTGVTQNLERVVLVGGTRLRVLSREGGVLRERQESRPTVTAQLYPSFLPDGRSFVFTQAATDPADQGVFVGSLESQRTARLIPVFSNAQVSAAGYLVYGSNGSILARRFDLARGSVSGEAIPLATDVHTSGDYTHFALGSDDTITYVRRQPDNESQLRWLERDGTPGETVGQPFPYRQVALAPGALRAVVERAGHGESPSSLWTIDLDRNALLRADVRLQGDELDPAWAPDGRQVAFTAWVDGDADLFAIALDASGPPRRLARIPGMQWAQQWSRDGRWVLYVQSDSATKHSVWAVPGAGGTPRLLVESRFGNFRPELSPDNRWLAYVSDESGRPEVYAQRWEELGKRWKVSSDGGGQPKWRADGQELFYVAPDATLMAVPVPLDGLPGMPQPLFKAPLDPTPFLNKYGVTDDGRRFLVVSPIERADPARLIVVSNWPALLN